MEITLGFVPMVPGCHVMRTDGLCVFIMRKLFLNERDKLLNWLVMKSTSSLDRFSSNLYRIFLRRNSTFLPVILLSAIVFEMSFDGFSDRFFRHLNRGVS
jgi:hypothetical protein